MLGASFGGVPAKMRSSSSLGYGAGALLMLGLAALPSAAQSPAASKPVAPPACSITLQSGEEGSLTAKSGDMVSVCLPISSGTGYSWQVQMGSDAFTLDPKPSTERAGTQPGAPAVTRFTMKAAGPGDYTLIFMLLPPGNSGAEAGRAFVGLKVL